MWIVGRCIEYTGIRLLLLIRLFNFSFFFFSNFQTLKFSSYFSQELWGLEDWNLVQTWTVGRFIVFTGIRLLLLIRPFIFPFFLLSSFLTLKFFVNFFSGTVRPRRLKLGINVNSGQMYRVYRNQAAAPYSSLYFPFFFLSNFQTLKFFVKTFLLNWGLEGWNLVHTWKMGGCIVYTGIMLLLIRPFIFSFFFLSSFQTLKIFVTLLSGTVRPRRLKLGTHVDNGQMYRVYRNQAAAAYSSLYFFIFLSLQFSNIEIFRQFFLRNCEA